MNSGYSPGTLLANSAWVAPDYSGLVTQITGYKLVNTAQDLPEHRERYERQLRARPRRVDATGYAFKTLGFASKTAFTGQFDGMWRGVSNLHPDISFISDIAANAVVRDVRPPRRVSGIFTTVRTVRRHSCHEQSRQNYEYVYVGRHRPAVQFLDHVDGRPRRHQLWNDRAFRKQCRVYHGSAGGGLV